MRPLTDQLPSLFLGISFGYGLDIGRMPFEYISNVVRISFECRLNIVWISFECRLNIVWISFEHRFKIGGPTSGLQVCLVFTPLDIYFFNLGPRLRHHNGPPFGPVCLHWLGVTRASIPSVRFLVWDNLTKSIQSTVAWKVIFERCGIKIAFSSLVREVLSHSREWLKLGGEKKRRYPPCRCVSVEGCCYFLGLGCRTKRLELIHFRVDFHPINFVTDIVGISIGLCEISRVMPLSIHFEVLSYMPDIDISSRSWGCSLGRLPLKARSLEKQVAACCGTGTTFCVLAYFLFLVFLNFETPQQPKRTFCSLERPSCFCVFVLVV